jgi:hypothetical protein
MKKSIYALLATALLAIVVMPIAFAGANNGSGASASANANASVKKQLKALKQRIAALEGDQPTTLPPSGPAGGNLTGNYPNPAIAPGAVTTAKIAPEAVTTAKLADGAVNSSQIFDSGIQAPDMGIDSVGGFALKGVQAVVGTGVSVSAGQTKAATVTCPGSQMLIAGGFAWTDNEANSIIASAPSEGDPNQTWVVEGQVDAGSNTLFAWATCIAV